jgi:hypothetical protein
VGGLVLLEGPDVEHRHLSGLHALQQTPVVDGLQAAPPLDEGPRDLLNLGEPRLRQPPQGAVEAVDRGIREAVGHEHAVFLCIHEAGPAKNLEVLRGVRQ